MFLKKKSCLFFILFFPLICLAKETLPPLGAVASAHPLATKAGIRMLKSGGNAFDAAIAVASTLAVVEPYGSGLGGGGFWLLYKAKTHEFIFIDGREKSPLNLTEAMLLDDKGLPKKELILNSSLGAGIPGEIASFNYLSKNLGKKSRQQQLKTAIEYAEKGFYVTEPLRKMIKFRQEALQKNEETRNIFLDNNQVPSLNKIIKQPALAVTLKTISAQGFDTFYNGELANKIIENLLKTGSIWQKKDLVDYTIAQRKPLIGRYKNFNIITAPLPPAGGIALLSSLNILNTFDLDKFSHIEKTHLLTEVFRRVYFDRLQLGDADFITNKTQELLSMDHAKLWAQNISLNHATKSVTLPPALSTQEQKLPQKEHTTHFSIIDKEGNIVAATLSLNLPFGCACIIPNTGIFLNNQLDDFSIGAQQNSYGLINNKQNHLQPSKRPLSSMTPTIIENEQTKIILGTPGGSRIPTMVILSSIELMNKSTAEHAAKLARFHHQFMPDHIEYEPSAFTEEEIAILQLKGHSLVSTQRNYGNMQIIVWNKQKNILEFASDPRGEGMAKNDN